MTAVQLLEAALYALRSAARGDDERLVTTVFGLRAIVALAHDAGSYALPAEKLIELLHAANDVCPIIETAITGEMPFHRASFAFFATSIVIEAFGRAGEDDHEFWTRYCEAVEHIGLIASELEVIYRRQRLENVRSILPAQWRFYSEATPFGLVLN